MKATTIVWSALFILFFSLLSATANAQTLLTGDQASKTVTLENLELNAAKITGTAVNRSPHAVRELDLLIQYHWLWKDEFHPGKDSPGRSDQVKLDKEIPPGESIPFSYTPQPPLPSRNDGYFEPEVSIAGFTIVIPQNTPSPH